MGNNPDANEFLKRVADELEKNPPRKGDEDNGHTKLMDDLARLTEEAYHYEFHDFKNTKYAAPKVELRAKLLAIAQNVIEGKYDN